MRARTQFRLAMLAQVAGTLLLLATDTLWHPAVEWSRLCVLAGFVVVALASTIWWAGRGQILIERMRTESHALSRQESFKLS